MKRRIVLTIISIVLVCFGAACSSGQSLEELLELGQRYLLEENYEEAVVAFEKAIALDEKCVEAYVGAADAYVGLDKTDEAIRVLEAGYENTQDEGLLEKLNGLRRAGEDDYIVQWQDRGFESMIRKRLGKETGDILRSELDEIYSITILGATHCFINEEDYLTPEGESIWSFNYTVGQDTLLAYYGLGDDDDGYKEKGNVYSIADIVHFRNLNSLTVLANHVSDLTPLRDSDVTVVNFFGNEISDFSVISEKGIEVDSGFLDGQFAEISE